jgi:hypothetical protein
MVIGHSDAADLVLADQFVSRRHALVSVDPSGQVTIQDLNSTGGTFVNDERLDGPRVLRAGDRVRFADLEARFELGGVEVAQTEIIEAAESAPEISDSPDGDHRFVVSGRVTWPDGSLAAGVIVRAVDQDLRREQPLGPHAPKFEQETRTDDAGCYEIRYRRTQFKRAEIKNADLIVRVLDANGAVVTSSPTTFNAPAEATIDLTLSGAVAGQPSEYDRLVAVLSPVLHDADPPEVTSLKSTDLDFLAGETGQDRAHLTALLDAVTLYQDATAALRTSPIGAAGDASTTAVWTQPATKAITSPDLLVPAFYGLLREGLSADWAQLLQAGESAISSSLVSAVTDGIIPAPVGQDASQIAAELAGLAAKQVITGTGGSSTAVSALLGAASLSSAQQQTLVTAAIGATGTPQEFWASLPSQPGFDAVTVARLQLTLQLGLLTGNNVPLVQALLAQPSVSSVKDLVSMDAAGWTQLLSTPVGGQPVPVPAGVPGATPAEQLQNYAQYLRGTIQSIFPNETVAHLVATGVISTEPATQAAIGQFFANSPDFDIRTTRITSYVAANGSAAFAGIPAGTRPAVVSELQRLQRAFQISVSADSMTTLLQLGLDAAHLVADIPPKSFTDGFSEALGGSDTAEAIYQRATHINARNIGLIVQLNDAVNGVTVRGLGGTSVNGGSSAKDTILQQLPDLADLFGALDPCACDQCTSVISPAAYLVDMLQFLGGSTPNDFLPPGSTPPAGPSRVNASGNTPLDVLIGGGNDPLRSKRAGSPQGLPGRRPDLKFLKLTCENTNTELPYIDLVNEVMEAYILYDLSTQFAAHDTGDTTTTELDASPQYTLDAPRYTIGGPLPKPLTAPDPLPLDDPSPPPMWGPLVVDGPYVTLANSCYPFTLPFNLPIAVARTYLQWLGTSRYQVMNAFQTDQGLAGPAIDAEYLQLDPYTYQLLTGTTITGQPAPPPPAADLYGDPPAAPNGTWEASLASVPTFLQQTGIQATDLIALLQTRFAGAPAGPDQALLNKLPFGYSILMTLVNAGFNTGDPAVLAADPTIVSDLTGAGIDAQDLQAWWERDPGLAQTLVIYSPDGSCDTADASISQLGGLGGPAVSPADRPSPGPHPSRPGPPLPSPVPTDTQFETLQAFIRLWRVLGWSMADLDRAFTALGVTAVTSGTAVLIPATFIHDLAQIAHLQATLNPPVLQVLFALWGDLDPDGQDSLYLQLFANPAALPNDPAFAPGQPDGAVLQDTTQTITGHAPALLAGLQVTAGDLALIRADAGLADLAPAAGDVIVGGGLAEPCTVTTVSGSGPYTVMASQEIPAGTNVTFAGGAAGVWTGTGTPAGAGQMTLTLTAGSAPQTGDLVLGGGLVQPLRITSVTGAGPYTVTTSAAIPAAGTFAGGPAGVWAGTASPSGGSSTMSLTIAPWPLTLPNVSLLYRYAALAQALGLSLADFITLKTLAALDPFASPDATSAFTKIAQQLQQSNFTASQLAYLYQDVSAPPTGLAPQPSTLQLLAKPLRDGLAQIAAQCTIVPDPKGTLTASTITQLVSKTAATATVALINGTAAYTAPLAALPLVYAWTGTASPPGGTQMTLALTAGSAPQPGDAMVGGGEQFTLSAVSVSGYAVMVSQTVPAGTGVTFAGGPGGAWLGTASPGGTDQMTLTVTAGPAPQAGDTITGGGLPQQCTISVVSGNGPYTITASQPIPAGTGVTFAGGPGGAWLGTASPGGTDQMTLTVTAGPAPRPGDAITGGGLPQPSTVSTVAASGYLITTSQLIPGGTGVTFSGGSIARLDASGNITGIDPARTPAEVGAKISYGPAAGTLTYKGAMTSQEQTDLLALSPDPGWQAAIASLYGQPAGFLADNLAPLLDDPGAPTLLLHNTASLDGSLNPVLVDAAGQAEPDPAQAASTAIAWKFAYLLGKLLPYLQNTLSHALVKQTIADAFTLDPALTSLLLEQALTAPGAPPPSPPPSVITSLLALGTPGVTATYYATTDLSGPPMAPPATVAGTSFDLSAANQNERIPAGAQSASFAAWLEVPSSNTFTFTVTTNGTPQLFVGDQSAPLTADQSAPGRYSIALTAGSLTYVGLHITSLPPGQQGTATLSWQSPGAQAATASPAAPSPQGASIPNAPIPGPALLPDAVYQTFGTAYIRIQKAALLASQFTLTAAEIPYLTGTGAPAPPLDLNALPLTPGVAVPVGTAAALFAVWLRLYAYTTLRNSLPNGPVTLVDLFSASTFGTAAPLLPQATGWPQEAASELLSAFFPALTPASPNPLTDEITLTAMQACADLAQRTGASPAQLFSWAQYAWTNPPTATPQEATYAGLQAIAEDIQNTTAANYDAQAWSAVAEQLNNTLRASRRDALVSYLMGQLGYTDPNQLFELLLIDPEMGACMQTSRIRQALNSVQLFVQRCLLGLEINKANPAVSVDPSQIDATTWRTWMSTYSTWAANREVFLWPENWLLPSLRDDQTEIFQAFASSLQQGTITGETVSTAFLTYLQGLEQIDRLDIRGVFKDDSGVLHVFARTWHDPKVYFYRRLVGNPGGTQTWTPWQQVSADIQGDFLIPVFWENKLRLIWPVFTQQTYTPPPSPVTGTTSGGTSGGSFSADAGSPPQNYWQITLAWSDLYQGTWQPKQVSTDFLVSACFGPGVYLQPQPSQEQHVFKARIDDADLVIDTYFPPYSNLPPYQGVNTSGGPVFLGEFRFSACGDTVTVGYANMAVSPPATDGIAPSPNLSTSQPASAQLQSGAQLLWSPYADAYNNGARQETAYGTPQVLQLLTGSFGDTPWPIGQVDAPASTVVTFLNQTSSRFELRYSQQHWQFAMQEPFFYQDAERTFFVAAGSGLSVVWWGLGLINANNIDVRGSVLSLAGSSYVPLKPLKPVPAASGNASAAAPSVIAPGAQARNAIATAPAPTSGPAATGQATGEALSPLVSYTGVPAANWASLKLLKYQPSSTLINGLLFQTHRHPYVCQLIESLVAGQGQSQSGGIDGLLNLANQNLSNHFDFFTYKPDAGNVLGPPPTETVDFTPTGAYSGYNWELFFHAPLLVALSLSQNGQYEDADTWFRYIFDPTSPSPYWQVQPFTTSVPETLLQLMNDVNDDSSSGHADAVAQVAGWYQNPFQPFVIARSRIGAFQKYVFMAYLDNLIAWADQLYGQVDSIESINKATQLYVLVSDHLGELPEQIPAPQSPNEPDYASIQGKLDAFSNFSEMLENEFPYAGPVTSDPQSQASGLLGLSKTLFFCIPQNQQLLQYWSTVAGRLYNIRHCLNIQGVPQQLALFQPPANPLLLIEAEAEGIDPGSVLADVSAPLPNYRFSYLSQRAAELASTCQSFGRQFLDVLEKNDSEGLALLRATQETQILNQMTDMKQQQVNEAQANVTALSASRAVAVTRYNYYQLLLGAGTPAVPAFGASIDLATVPTEPPQPTGGVQLISEEASELSLSTQAALLHAGAGLLQTLASQQAMMPTISAGTAFEPFGTGGNISVSFGGSNFASSIEAVVHGIETAANYLTYQAWSAGKMGGYFRRQQEWTLQSNLAAGEIMQIDQQTQAANVRVTIAQDDLDTHTQQIANAQKVQDYLTAKFTSQQLYTWMIGQVSSLYSQLYQLAYSTAKLAEVAYQRELGIPESNYITFGYWDSMRKGLLAGDRLQLAVKQLERAYIDQNQREFEITRHVSLLLHDPAALIALKTTGECLVDLPEALFDTDYPGQYLRRLRDVSLTIPCVAGPYTSINCTLTLVSSKIRFNPSTGNGNAASYPEKPVNQDFRFIYNFGSTAAIATSHAQDDSGVFSVNFRDERYLPFETAGAVSTWLISMPPGCNAFDFDTITDVILKLSYTSRYGGDLLRSQAYAAAVQPPPAQQTAAPSLGAAPAQTAQDRLFSLKHEFPNEWYGLLHPASGTAAYGQMPVWTVTDRFPFQYRGRKIQVTGISVFALLQPGTTPPDSLSIYLINTSMPMPADTPPTPPGNPGTQVSLKPDTLYGTRTLYGIMPAPSSPVTVPQLWWLSIAQSDLNTVIDSVDDFFILVQYKVT